jgi:hypothetical protein
MVESEDDPESWRQVAALGSMAGLLDDQRKRLESAREGLIQAWPPEQNAAAKAFVELVDDLLLNMQRNREIADSNASALGRVVETLRQAKADIDPLYKAYLKKNDDWVPAWWDNAEDELDEKARERMRAAEAVIAQPDNKITVPPAYELRPDFTRTKIDSDEATAGGPAAVRPGPAAVGFGGAGSDFTVPHEPPPPVPGREATSVGGATLPAPVGPELAGVVTPSSLPGSALPTALPTPAGPSAVSAGPGLVIGGAAPFSPLSPRAGGGGRVGGGPPGLPAGSGMRSGVSAPGNPAAKPATPSWLPPVAGQPSRGGPAAGSRGTGTPGMPLTGGRRPEREDSRDVTFDPDSPWATAEGVDPVIEPSRRIYRHDPGPGVIGWSR